MSLFQPKPDNEVHSHTYTMILKTEPEGCSGLREAGMERKARSRGRNCTYSLRVTDSDQAGCGDVGRRRQRGNLCGESAGRAHQGFKSSLRSGPHRPLRGEERELL